MNDANAIKSKWESDEPIGLCRWDKVEIMPMNDGTISLCVLPIKDQAAFQNLGREDTLLRMATIRFSPFATVHLTIEEVEDLAETLLDYVKWRKANGNHTNKND